MTSLTWGEDRCCAVVHVGCSCCLRYLLLDVYVDGNQVEVELEDIFEDFRSESEILVSDKGLEVEVHLHRVSLAVLLADQEHDVLRLAVLILFGVHTVEDGDVAIDKGSAEFH